MADEAHVLATAERRIHYPTITALYLDIVNQLRDGEDFSVIDPSGKTIITGTWHPLTPSRY